MLIGAGYQAEGMARVVVEGRERMTAARPAGPTGFGICLPQVVGVRLLEPPNGAQLADPVRGVQGRVAAQDRVAGGDAAGTTAGAVRPELRHGRHERHCKPAAPDTA